VTAGGWASVSPELREIVERCCTKKQAQVVRFRAGGMSWAQISLALGVTRETARGLEARAHLNIRQEIAAMRGLGNQGLEL
jgi:DNA-binding CsgD family transcriptional regulator